MTSSREGQVQVSAGSGQVSAGSAAVMTGQLRSRQRAEGSCTRGGRRPLPRSSVGSLVSPWRHSDTLIRRDYADRGRLGAEDSTSGAANRSPDGARRGGDGKDAASTGRRGRRGDGTKGRERDKSGHIWGIVQEWGDTRDMGAT